MSTPAAFIGSTNEMCVALPKAVPIETLSGYVAQGAACSCRIDGNGWTAMQVPKRHRLSENPAQLFQDRTEWILRLPFPLPLLSLSGPCAWNLELGSRIDPAVAQGLLEDFPHHRQSAPGALAPGS